MAPLALLRAGSLPPRAALRNRDRVRVRVRPPSSRTATGATEQLPSLTALIRAGDRPSLLPRLIDPALPQQLLQSDDEGHTPLHWAPLASAALLATPLPLATRLGCLSSNPPQLQHTHPPALGVRVSAFAECQRFARCRGRLFISWCQWIRRTNICNAVWKGSRSASHSFQMACTGSYCRQLISHATAMGRLLWSPSLRHLPCSCSCSRYRCRRSLGATALHRALQRNHHLIASAHFMLVQTPESQMS